MPTNTYDAQQSSDNTIALTDAAAEAFGMEWGEFSIWLDQKLPKAERLKALKK